MFLAYSRTEVGGAVDCELSRIVFSEYTRERLIYRGTFYNIQVCSKDILEGSGHLCKLYFYTFTQSHFCVKPNMFVKQWNSCVWGEYGGRNGGNGTFLCRDSPEYGWITQVCTFKLSPKISVKKGV